MLLYQANGTPVQREIPLYASQVRALCDGNYFVANGAEVLSAVQLEPYCRYCAVTGLPASIGLTSQDNLLKFKCAHIAGHIRKDRPVEFGKLFDELGWGIRCTACQSAATGDNSIQAEAFTVSCPCTVRTLLAPRIGKAS